MDRKIKPLHLILLATFLLAFLWSGINPYDRPTWALEVFPAAVGLFLIVIFYNRFQFTDLVYCLIWAHALILLTGGHYTYARVPFFDYLKEALSIGRNHFDRLGHFAQGFVPAMIAREILVRRSPVKKGGWLYFLTVCVVLSISAFYELLEWWSALLWGAKAEEFLATQGDVWDTQWDMFMAFAGANLSLLLLGRAHDRQIEGVEDGRG